MRNKETGEFELVVGYKQLLSGFFIGVLLLAVVFAMGYVLGQSSPKSAKVTSEPVATTTAPEVRPQPASPAPSSNPDAGATPPAQPADAAPPAGAQPQPTTVPARDASAPPPKAPKPAEPPVADPGNASYWQVTAASKNSAEAVSQTLKDKGFPVTTRPGPNNLTLVWVGPYFDKDTLTKAKKLLEDAGFNPFKKP